MKVVKEREVPGFALERLVICLPSLGHLLCLDWTPLHGKCLMSLNLHDTLARWELFIMPMGKKNKKLAFRSSVSMSDSAAPGL